VIALPKMTWLVLFSTQFGSTFGLSLQPFLFLDILAERNRLDSALMLIEIHYCYYHGLCHSYCLGLHSYPPKPLLFLMLIPVMMICCSFSNQMLVLSSTCLANCPRCATNITRDINAPGEGGIGIITHGTWWNTSQAEK